MAKKMTIGNERFATKGGAGQRCRKPSTKQQKPYLNRLPPPGGGGAHQALFGAGCCGARAGLTVEQVLADTLRLFLALPRDALTVVHMRYEGMMYREIGDKLGIGTAAAEMKHKRLLESIPALKELFPGKARKRAARRKRGGRGQ